MTKEATPMSKFNTVSTPTRPGESFIKTKDKTTVTFEGGEGVLRKAKSELYMAVISDFGGEKTFYESAEDRSARISKLVKKVAVKDVNWLTGLAGYLRNEANLRSISLTVALEGAKALNDAKIPGGRQLVAGALRRADEPGEALAYWFANYGRTVPSAVKRAIADAAVKSYNQYSLGKYDTPSHGFRFGDVLELTHAKPKDVTQNALFNFALGRRRNSALEPTEALEMVAKRNQILSLSEADKRKLILSDDAGTRLSEAGLTWEVVGGAFGKGGLDAKAWEALIPSMGYMSLLRNLRNFEDKGVSNKVLDAVASRISDPEEVAKSRQLPFRFLAAHRAVSGYSTDAYGYTQRSNTGSARFVYPLEQALNHSLSNVPALKGRTLVLVDRSGSMFGRPSENTQLNFADTAALFGTALAVRSEDATLVQFGSTSKAVDFKKSSSILNLVDSFGNLGGTSTAQAVRQHFNGHDRVVIITDEQSYGEGPLSVLPKHTKGFVWNLVGYRAGSGAASQNRVYMGGLSDQSFKTIPLLEAGQDQKWPWEA